MECCLGAFFLPENLTKDEQVECEACKKKVDCEKKFHISKLPQVLCLHVKRFKFSHDGKCTKLSSTLHYDLDGLDLQQFCDTDGMDEQQGTYSLFGVVSHIGSCTSGHYIAYARNYSDGQWYRFDDSKVSSFESKSLSQVEPYLLFYLRDTENCPKAQHKRNLMLMLETVPRSPSSHDTNLLVCADWFAKWFCIDCYDVDVSTHQKRHQCIHNRLRVRSLQAMNNLFVEVNDIDTYS